MNLNIITNTARGFGRKVNRNAPTLLTIFGVAGVVSTVVLAVKATPKALEILEQEEKKRQADIDDPEYGLPITTLDMVKLTWQCYIPTAGMGVMTIACILGANSIHLKRQAVLASLYSVSEKTLQRYQAKVVEKLGEKKEEKIRGEVAQGVLDKNPSSKHKFFSTGHGDTPCYDVLSGRYFFHDPEKIRQVQNDCNARLLREMNLTVNDFYSALDIDAIELGDEMGWTVEKGQMDIHLTAMLADDKRPCVVVEHRVRPIPLWR